MSAASGRLSIRRQLTWGFLLFLIAIVPTYFLVSAIRDGLAQLRALRTLDADAAGKGAGTVFHGRFVSAPRKAMVSQQQAVWIGELGATEGSGKSSHYVVYCVLRGIDGATVRDESGRVVTLTDFDALGFRGRVMPIDGRPAAAIDLSDDHVQVVHPTPEILKACSMSDRVGLSYREEYATTPGTEVMMRGCAAPGGTAFRPCGDGFDFVSDRPIDAMRADLKEGHEWGVGSGAIPILLFGGLLMLLARAKRVIDSRPEGSR